MQPTQLSTAEAIAAECQRLSAKVDKLHMLRDPGLVSRYAENVRTALAGDVAYELRVLSDAIRTDTPELFSDYIRW